MMETDPNSARCIIWATEGVLFFVFLILTKIFLFYIGLIYKILNREAGNNKISSPQKKKKIM